MHDALSKARFPGVSELSQDPVALCVWEAARRSTRPASAAALAATVGHDLAVVMSGIDRLEEVGLLSRIPARGRHRAARYVATCKRLVLTAPSEDQPAQSRMVASWERWRDTHMIPPVAEGNGDAGEALDRVRYQFCGMTDLAEQDARELARRIRAVVDFLHTVADRNRGTGAPGEGSTRTMHAISVRLDPLASNVAPMPAIESVVGPVDGWNGHLLRPVATNGKLSAAEHRVADAMVQGMSRPDIARTLGVSINTVGTLARRLFRKLGVRSRAELAAMLPPPPALGHKG